MRRKGQASASDPTPATARAIRWRLVIRCEGRASSPIVHLEQYAILINGPSNLSSVASLATLMLASVRRNVLT